MMLAEPQRAAARLQLVDHAAAIAFRSHVLEAAAEAAYVLQRSHDQLPAFRRFMFPPWLEPPLPSSPPPRNPVLAAYDIDDDFKWPTGW